MSLHFWLIKYKTLTWKNQQRTSTWVSHTACIISWRRTKVALFTIPTHSSRLPVYTETTRKRGQAHLGNHGTSTYNSPGAHTQLEAEGTLLSNQATPSFLKWGNWGSERRGDFSKVSIGQAQQHLDLLTSVTGGQWPPLWSHSCKCHNKALWPKKTFPLDFNVHLLALL